MADSKHTPSIAENGIDTSERSARKKVRQAAYYAAHKEEKKAYALDHKEEGRAKSARYRAAHREKVLACYAAYHAAHREEENEKTRIYRMTHRNEHNAKRAARRMAYTAVRRAEQRAATKNYRAAHPEIFAASRKRYRARKTHAPLNDFTHQQWVEMQDAYDYRCVYCHKRFKGKLTQDHIQPLSKGGSHTYSNIVPACKSCNSRKQAGPVLCSIQPLLLIAASAKKTGILTAISFASRGNHCPLRT
jgi:5-methylcytosine-specific restriction endonuclease McrA